MSGRRPGLPWRRLPVSKHGPGVSRRHHIIGDVPRSAKRFASWLGLIPNNRIPGGKVLCAKTKASANRAAAALRLAASALHPYDHALDRFLRQKKPTWAHLKVIASTQHRLSRLSDSTLRYNQESRDAGAEPYRRQYLQRALRAGQSHLEFTRPTLRRKPESRGRRMKRATAKLPISGTGYRLSPV